MSATVEQMRIALIEDDPLLRKEIHFHLKQVGFIVFAVSNGKSLDELLTTEPIDALVLDLTLPGEDGVSIAQRIRQSIPAMGIVMLTARTSLPDRLKGYEAGADIYLSKPISPEELTSTLLSLHRRVLRTQIPASWSINLQERSLTGLLPQQKVMLTNSEKVLLVALIQAPGNTLETEMICQLLNQRQETEDIGKRALESLVSRLRKKIASVMDENADPALRAVWGVGYQLCLRIDIKP